MEQDIINHNKRNLLKHFMWESTRSCNLLCKHCGSNSGHPLKDELSTSEVKSMLDDVADLGALFFSITGGEPLLRKDIFEIIKYAYDLGLNTTLITNGSLIDRDIVVRLRESGLRAVSISLDGTRDFHNENRGKDCYDNVMQAFKLFKQNGIITCASVIVFDQNFKYISQIYDTCNRIHIDRLNLYLPQSTGRARENKIALNSDKIAELIEFKISNENKFSDENNIDKEKLRTKIYLDDGFGPFDDHFECTAGKSHMFVSAIGDIKACISFPYYIGNIRKKSIIDVWKSNLFDAFRKFKPEKLEQPCSDCRLVHTCGGGCRARALFEYNDFFAGNRECASIIEKKPNWLNFRKIGSTIGIAGLLLAAGCATSQSGINNTSTLRGFNNISDHPRLEVETPGSGTTKRHKDLMFNPLCEEKVEDIDVKKLSFRLGGSCGYDGYANFEFESRNKINLDKISFIINGIPINAGITNISVEKSLLGYYRYSFELNYSINLEILYTNQSSIILDYSEIDILSSGGFLESVELKHVIPVRKDYPINLYLYSNFDFNEEDVTIKMNNQSMDLRRLVKLDKNLYLITINTSNAIYCRNNRIEIKVKDYLLTKVFAEGFSDPYYIDESFVSICPMIPMYNPYIKSASVISDDTLIVTSDVFIPNDISKFSLFKRELNESSRWPTYYYKEISKDIGAEHLEEYGYILRLEQELKEGTYALNVVKGRPLVEFNVNNKLKKIHLLQTPLVSQQSRHVDYLRDL